MSKPTRRDVVKAAAAIVAATALPFNKGPSAKFATLWQEFEQALSVFRRARLASRLARPRIFADVRKRGFGSFFTSPEIRARSAARQTAQALAEQIFRLPAANEAEAWFQKVASDIYESELGGSPVARTCCPPGYRDISTRSATG